MTMCVAQVFTSVKAWERMYAAAGQRWCAEAAESKAQIRMCKVQDTLLKLRAEDSAAFMRICCLGEFRTRYGSAEGPGAKPFANAPDLAPGSTEWQRRLIVPGTGRREPLLCCPEDVERGPLCRHAEDEVCADCSVPLCLTCERAIVWHEQMTAPMVLGNDNFWGYTTDIIYRYQVFYSEGVYSILGTSILF